MSKPEDPRHLPVVLPPEDATAPLPLRYRFDGWTPTRQRAFVQALGETGCVRDACKAVRLSSTSAYRCRARVPEFAREWDRALDFAATVLEHTAFERAVTGILEPIVHNGKIIGERRHYSDSLLRMMILHGDLRAGMGRTPADLMKAAHDAAKAAGGTFGSCVSQQETDALLRKMLDAMALKLARGRDATAATGPVEGD